MKLIKMRTLAAGPDGTLDPGRTYPADDKAAAALVDGGFADYAEPPRLEKATRPPEPENAVKPDEKAVHVGGGWYDYKGQRYKKTDLPEGAI